MRNKCSRLARPYCAASEAMPLDPVPRDGVGDDIDATEQNTLQA